MILDEKTRIQFTETIHIQDSHACWEWTGKRGQKGSPAFQYKGEQLSAHKVLLAVYYAFELPKTWTFTHICCNPSCMNPAHVSITTPTGLEFSLCPVQEFQPQKEQCFTT